MHEQVEQPAHHARRPMNAFLIFCKRHRTVVRDKYPNLENRSITKILGEWWANLEKEEKVCYTVLAKQYKDAFFSANPDFKWYKLPAPPLRTLSSRPRESVDKTVESSNSNSHERELEKTNNNSTSYDYNTLLDISGFTPGKLADEAQMGGLNSLLANKTEDQTPNPYYSPPSYEFNAISAPIEFRSQDIELKPDKDDSAPGLQNAFSESTEERKYNYSAPNDSQITYQDVINQIVDKRYSKDDDVCQRNSSDDEKNSKSGRSCKGKRYQEFMAVGGLIVNKRQKKDYPDRLPDDGYSPSCSLDLGSFETVTDGSKGTVNEDEIDIKEEPIIPEPDNNQNKTFKASDFDLEAKIRALPYLSLEKFQQKKRDNKRKKKTIHLKPKPHENQIINSVPRSLLDDRRKAAESWRDTVIGSQKRKPRKISITRLEVNSLVSNDMNRGHKISPEIKFATEAPCTIIQNMDMSNQTHSDDLLALATLAEVASHTSKLEEIANDDASKV